MNQKPYSFFKGIALTIAMAAAAVVAQAQYCIPTYSIQCDNSTFINNISTTGGTTNITNNNTGCGNTSTSYSDYTSNSSMRVVQNAGSNVTVTVKMGPSGGTAGTYVSRIQIYVDWNQNGDFTDAGDLVGFISALTGGGSSGNASFTVPLSAKHGLTRMRIRAASRKSIPEPGGSFSPCGNHQEGEAEDYNFEVVNPCVPPTGLTVSNVDYKSATISWNVKQNAKLYEYYFTNDKSTIPPTSMGYTYTSATTLNYNNLICDTMYYFYLRSVCDTTGSTIFWDTSAWTVDSFRTDPCCYAPNVSVQNVGASTAVASWAPINTAYGYEYIVSVNATLPQVIQGTYTTYTSAFLQGLSGSTQYYVHVRSRCSPTPLSGWTTTGFLTQPAVSVNTVSGNNMFDVSAYPNPVENNLTVEINGKTTGNASVWLIDITGKVISNTPVTSNKVNVDMTSLPSGLYTVKYVDDVHNEVLKVTKQ